VADWPDGGACVVSGGADGLVRFWDPLTWTETAEPTACGSLVLMLSVVELDGAGAVVCVLTADGSVHRADLLTGKLIGPPVQLEWRPLRPRMPFLGSMTAVSARGRGVIATCADTRSVQLWDLLAGEPTVQFTASRVWGLAAARLADGTPLIVTSDNNGYVRRFDAFTGSPVGEPVAPHGWAASEILPVRMPDGRIILAVERQGRVRRFDARTGEPLGDPRRPWHAGHYGLAAAPLPDGRVILTAGGESGMSRQDVLSGAEYPPGDDRKTGTISDVTMAAPTDGSVIIAGAGYHSKVHRWDAATGAALGEPLTGHERSVRAVMTARQADGSPMFITGCEHGSVLCWDAATGELTGECLPGAMDDVSDLAVADHPAERATILIRESPDRNPAG
jgi:WD40 repeat protein